MVKKKSASSIDVLNHYLVPEMKIIDEGEKKRVLKKFGISEEKLPKMFVTDSAVQALKAVTGDIVAINRKDLIGNYTVYKIIVENTK